MNIETLICPASPERIFHYTDQKGLFGILDSGELWATRIHCLNDHQEFCHGIDSLLAAVLMRNGTRVGADIEEQLARAFQSVRALNICVSSWSEHQDQLSQWRAYGKSRQGYALGLRSEDLKERAEIAGWMFGRCVYDDGGKRNLSKLIAERFWSRVAEYEQLRLESSGAGRFEHLLHETVFPYASFLKHNGFSEESEWRLVSPIIERTDKSFTVRPGPFFPVTYYRFPVSGGALSKLEAELIIGPGISQELASHGAAVAANRSKFDVMVRRYSLTPWRTDS